MSYAYYLGNNLSPEVTVIKQILPDTARVLEYKNPSINEFFSQFADLSSEETMVMETASRTNVESIPKASISTLVNIRRINDIHHLNDFFESVNEKLPYDGIFIGCVETKSLRRKRMLNKHSKPVSYPWYIMDNIVHSVLPEWGVTRKVRQLFGHARNRIIALPEVLGRIAAGGFRIISLRKIDGLLYFVVRKTGKPVYNEEPSGTLFKMKRIGKDKKTIVVYKIRTMHRYSEHLQQYVFENCGTSNGDKPTEDFRITQWGRLLRRFWVDEVPMLINLLKGELKLVGVRPLSYHKFNMYPMHLQEKRVKVKPGLIPPFYVHMPKTQEEFFKAEEAYLESYEKDPLMTDVKYFFKAWYNIIVKRARSS